MNETQKAMLLTALLRVELEYMGHQHDSICTLVGTILRQWGMPMRQRWAIGSGLEKLMAQWPKAARKGLPVPGINGMGPFRTYTVAAWNGTMWVGEYGQLRLELLDFCIRKLREPQHAVTP